MYYWGLINYFIENNKLIIGFLIDIPLHILCWLLVIIKKIYNKDIHQISSKKNNYNPILLLHGLGSFDIQWIPIKLLYLFKYEVYTLQLNYVSNISLLDINIDNKINEIYKKTNKKICIIGHSMGGLIAANHINHPYINNIITITSPFRGTPIINHLKLSCNIFQEILPDSKVLDIINNKIKENNHKIYCFGSEHDFRVPYPYYIPKHIENSYNIKWNGHMSILFSNKLWKNINQILI
jgi:hypothetical protein